MWINDVSTFDALRVLAVIIALAYLAYRLVPGTGPSRPRTRFSDQDITAYDRALPKYFLAAFIALAVGAVHATVKSLPPVHAWLSDAGHGGHLVRDIANTHLVIVVGGTVAITGLTWYVLPRLLRRPLRSEKLAGLSFWCTLIGAGGFYLTNVVVGLVAGDWFHAGIGYEEAKELMGAWRAVPVGLSASIMGVGYWTFVVNVLITVHAARTVEEQGPDRHLAKWFVVGALGLFVGTVQGVIQVMPANEAWLHATAPAGEYIDPIAHAHVNLVTGSLVLVGALALWWSRRADADQRDRRREQRVFWVLVPGSLAFYTTFMALGFVEGSMMLEQDLTFQQVVDRLGVLHVAPIALAGVATLVGLWLLLFELVRRFTSRRASLSVAAPFVLVASAALLLGTSQGLLQLLPPVKAWIEMTGQLGDSVANAHAQLNMLGGVLLVAIGLTLQDARVLLRAEPRPTDALRWTRLLIAGALAYWFAVIVTAIADGGFLPDVARGPVADLVGPGGMAIGSGLYATAAIGLSAFAWRSTAAYRAEGVAKFRLWFDRYDGRTPAWVARVPRTYFLAAEAVMGLAGFPGLGWLLSGRARVGLPLALLGPGIAWALVPFLLSPYRQLPLEASSMVELLVWLGGSTVLSMLLLFRSVTRRQRLVRRNMASPPSEKVPS